MAVYVRRFSVVDVAGGVRTVQLVGNASMTVVEAAILLLSNGDEATESEAQIFVNSTPVPVNADYKTVQDVARLLYQTSAGTLIQVNIPAPKTTVFMADQETVDPASVASLTAVATGLLTDLSGNAVVAYVGGTRERGS